jgi:hypothetical protein
MSDIDIRVVAYLLFEVSIYDIQTIKTYSLRKVEQPGEKNRLKPGCLPYALSVKSLFESNSTFVYRSRLIHNIL